MQQIHKSTPASSTAELVTSSAEAIRDSEEARIANFWNDLQQIISSDEYRLACELLAHPTLGKPIKDKIKGHRSPAVGVLIGTFDDSPTVTAKVGTFLRAVANNIFVGGDTNFKARNDYFRAELDGDGLQVRKVIVGPLPGTLVGNLNESTAKKLARSGTTIEDVTAKIQTVCMIGLELAADKEISLK